MSDHVPVPRLSPLAQATVMRLVRHLDGDPHAGAFLILSRDTGSRPQVDTAGVNIDASGIVIGLMEGCHAVLTVLRDCQCGQDHGAVIVALERVLLLLSGQTERMQ